MNVLSASTGIGRCFEVAVFLKPEEGVQMNRHKFGTTAGASQANAPQGMERANGETAAIDSAQVSANTVGAAACSEIGVKKSA